MLLQAVEKAKLRAEWDQLDQDRRATDAEDERAQAPTLAGEATRVGEGGQKRPDRSTAQLKDDHQPEAAMPESVQGNPQAEKAKRVREEVERQRKAREDRKLKKGRRI